MFLIVMLLLKKQIKKLIESDSFTCLSPYKLEPTFEAALKKNFKEVGLYFVLRYACK